MIGDLTASMIVMMKIGVRMAFVLAAVFSFAVVLNLIISLVLTTIDGGVLGDLYGLLQMWAPFNIGTMMMWVTSGAVAYMTYRIAIVSIAFIGNIIGDN